MNLQKLHKIFKETIKRQGDKIDPVRSQFGNIEKDEVNLERKMDYIENYIHTHKRMSFRELLEQQNSKMEIIVTFLVILEMIKIGTITIIQDNLFEDIIIILRESEGA